MTDKPVPESAPLSDKEAVLQVWPDAVCIETVADAEHESYFWIYCGRVDMDAYEERLGRGDSENAAWADARSRLSPAQPPAQGEGKKFYCAKESDGRCFHQCFACADHVLTPKPVESEPLTAKDTEPLSPFPRFYRQKARQIAGLIQQGNTDALERVAKLLSNEDEARLAPVAPATDEPAECLPDWCKFVCPTCYAPAGEQCDGGASHMDRVLLVETIRKPVAGGESQLEPAVIPWDMPTADRDVYTMQCAIPPEGRTLEGNLFKKYCDLLFSEIQTSGLLRERAAKAEAKVECLQPLVDSADEPEGALMWTSDHEKILARELASHPSPQRWIATSPETMPQKGKAVDLWIVGESRTVTFYDPTQKRSSTSGRTTNWQWDGQRWCCVEGLTMFLSPDVNATHWIERPTPPQP